MKELLKRTLIRLGVRNLSDIGRLWRRVNYTLLDLAGYVIHSPHRLLTGRWKRALPDPVRKILMIRIDRIGDLILSTPAVRAVKETFPNARLDLLINGYTRDLVDGIPAIDRVLVDGTDHLDDDYDLALVLHPGFRKNRLAYRSGAPVTIGYTGSGGGFYLTRQQRDDRATRVRHEVESALEIAALAGCASDDTKLMISTTAEGDAEAEEFFSRQGIGGTVVAIHPGARQEYIRWKKEGFATVADTLIREDDVTVLLTGSTGEQSLVEEVAGLMEEEPVIACGLPLTTFISLIGRCQLFLGNSTGPMHIAAALGVPVVAVFGATHPLDSHHEWGPWGAGHLVVAPDPSEIEAHPEACTPWDCVELIDVEHVLPAVRRQLEKIR
ncbi:glycosyltransferase family 9 protein [Gemmatimonadota bacterium]